MQRPKIAPFCLSLNKYISSTIISISLYLNQDLVFIIVFRGEEDRYVMSYDRGTKNIYCIGKYKYKQKS